MAKLMSKKKTNRAYVLVMITFQEPPDVLFVSEVVGVYSSLKRGMSELIKLEQKIEKANIDDVLYDLVAFVVDEDPQLTEYLDEKIDTDEIAVEFMKKGYVEQLIGDDGKFYYKVTEKGSSYENYIKSFLPIVDN